MQGAGRVNMIDELGSSNITTESVNYQVTKFILKVYFTVVSKWKGLMRLEQDNTTKLKRKQRKLNSAHQLSKFFKLIIECILWIKIYRNVTHVYLVGCVNRKLELSSLCCMNVIVASVNKQTSQVQLTKNSLNSKNNSYWQWQTETTEFCCRKNKYGVVRHWFW